MLTIANKNLLHVVNRRIASYSADDLVTYIDCRNYVTNECSDIYGLKILWNIPYCNQPDLTVYLSCDEVKFIFRKLDLSLKSNVYEGYSEDTGLAYQLTHIPSNPRGLAGSIIAMDMEDGSTKCIKGPWHYGFIFTDRFNQAIPVSYLRKSDYSTIVPVKKRFYTAIGGVYLVSKYVEKVLRIFDLAGVRILMSHINGNFLINIDKESSENFLR